MQQSAQLFHNCFICTSQLVKCAWLLLAFPIAWPAETHTQLSHASGVMEHYEISPLRSAHCVYATMLLCHTAVMHHGAKAVAAIRHLPKRTAVDLGDSSGCDEVCQPCRPDPTSRQDQNFSSTRLLRMLHQASYAGFTLSPHSRSANAAALQVMEAPCR